MEFPPERVEQAIMRLNSGSPAAVNEVNEYLTAWTTSENVHETAFTLVMHSQNLPTKVTAASVLERALLQNYMRVSDEFNKQLVEASIRFLSGEEAPEPLEMPMASLISMIMVCVSPETGEKLTTAVRPTDEDSDLSAVRKARVWLLYIEKVSQTRNIPQYLEFNHSSTILTQFGVTCRLALRTFAIPGAEDIGLKLVQSQGKWFSGVDMVEDGMLDAILGLPDRRPELTDMVFEAIKELFVDRCDLAHTCPSMFEPVLRFFAARSEYSPRELGIVCLYLRKNWTALIRYMNLGYEALFGQLSLYVTDIWDLLFGGAVDFARKVREPEPKSEPLNLCYTVLEKVFHSRPLDYATPHWWGLWRDLVHVFVSNGIDMRTQRYSEFMNKLMHEALPALVANADTLLEHERLRYDLNYSCFRMLFEKDIPAAIEFIRQCPDANIFYVLGMVYLPQPPYVLFVRNFIMESLPKISTDEQKCRILFAIHKKFGLFTPAERETLVSYAVHCLTTTTNPDLQTAAAASLYGMFNRFPSCFKADLFVPHAGEFVQKFCPDAAKELIKLSSGIVSLAEGDHKSLIQALLPGFQTHPEVMTEVLGELTFVSEPFRNDLFTSTYKILLTLINECEPLEEQALTSLSHLTRSLQLESFSKQVDEIIQNLFSGNHPVEVGFEFFVLGRSPTHFFDRYAGFLNEQIAKHPVSASMFRMLIENFDPASFSFDVVSDKITEGVRDLRSDVNQATLDFVALLMNYTDPDVYERVTIAYRDLVTRVVLEAMTDGLHLNNFKKQAKIISVILAGALSKEGEGTPFLRTFADIWADVTKMPPDVVAKTVTSLATASSNILVCCRAIGQVLIVAKKAPAHMLVPLYSSMYEDILFDLEITGTSIREISQIPEENQDEENEQMCQEMRQLSVSVEETT